MNTLLQLSMLEAKVAALSGAVQDLLAFREMGSAGAYRPAPARKTPQPPYPRFWVRHSFCTRPGDTTGALALTVGAGAWWREGVGYAWSEGALTPEAYEAGTWVVYAKIVAGEDPAWVVSAHLCKAADYPPEGVEAEDLRVLALVSAEGAEGAETSIIWQRWFSDIYDGGTSFPSDWELERNTYQDSGMYYVDIGAGHFHWHGHLVQTIDDTTQLLVDTGTGYIYLSYEVATNTLSVVYTADFPESTSEVWNFMLYKFEDGRVVRDLRTSVNFGSPI